MSIKPGTRIGPYEVTSPLGEGGMGVVFRAHDTQLQRDVALKLLPGDFASDPDRLSRFQREAQVLASLNHPNIAQIYGLEESDQGRCIVMELVHGETLQERLKRGPIPIDEGLPIAKQIAEALEAAHEKGIVHRDLKPANITLSGGAKVKVLDFGLAKASQDQQTTTLSDSPTLMSASVPGVILGTAAYMSPEQAKGKSTDRTSDVWAFGCVFYEMLAGEAVFQGETIGEVVAEIFKSDPDWSRLPAATPEAIRRLLRRCLQKDPSLRLRDIGDARIEIHEAQSGKPDGPVSPAATSRRERLAWVSAMALVVALAIVGMLWIRLGSSSAPRASEIRLEITTPRSADSASLAISPDGRKIVFEATSDGLQRLWLRSLDSISARPLQRTDGAVYPFWSPDSRSVGFFAEGKLKRIDVDSGFIQTLANVPRNRGGTWNSEGTILFADLGFAALFRISDTGGEPVEVLKTEAGQAPMFPEFLPDGRRFLYYRFGRVHDVYMGQLDGKETRRLLDADSSAVYASSGQLLFVRQDTLFAQNFDPDRLTFTGNPFPLAEQLSLNSGAPKAPVSASPAGPIAYRASTATGQRQFVWFDRTGKEIEKVSPPDSEGAMEPSLSPDGRFLALQRTVSRNTDIWRLDVERGVLSRVTSDDARESNPLWSPKGDRIVFGSSRTGLTDLYVKSATGAEVRNFC